MDSRQIYDYLAPKLSIAERGSLDSLCSSIRAEARAEALKEAAERAVAWFVAPFSYGNEEAELRAAILADEPKEERGSEGPRPGDIVAWKREDGQEFITPCYCKENEPFISPKNWRRVILMRRAEVERKLKEASR